MLLGLRSPVTIDDALLGIRFVWGLQRHLRRPLSLEQARVIVRRRLERRQSDFLALVERAVYANPTSPYRELLRLAGCEYGDLERLVSQEGLEGSLRRLFERGVYLTVDELKGRQPIVRGSATLTVEPAALGNPNSVIHVLMQSSGSRGPRRFVPIDLGYVRDIAVDGLLADTARGGEKPVRAIWAVPGGTALYYFLGYGAYGVQVARWFSQVDAAAPGLDPRYRWSIRALRLGGFLASVRMPRQEHVPIDAPLPIARWMAECLAAGQTPHLGTFVSSAARLCSAAAEAGFDLAGARFQLAGEPLTETLLTTIRGVGGEIEGYYGSMETGSIATTCIRPERADDMHVLTDLHGLIQPGSGDRETLLPATALLISSLRPTAPFILLNASMGDQAELVERRCGCALESEGWTTHLHSIRSFEKLTAGGMTFLDTDVIPILERALPARFGGGPAEFQLVEEQTEGGQPRLCLRVHPSIGPLDPGEVADAFLTMIGGTAAAGRVMELQWRQAGVLRVERLPPLTTASGKILHLHQIQPQSAAPR